MTRPLRHLLSLQVARGPLHPHHRGHGPRDGKRHNPWLVTIVTTCPPSLKRILFLNPPGGYGHTVSALANPIASCALNILEEAKKASLHAIPTGVGRSRRRFLGTIVAR